MGRTRATTLLFGGLAVMLGTTFEAAKADTITYNIRVDAPSLGMTIADSTVSASVNQSAADVFAVNANVDITNNGNVTGEVYGQMGAMPSGLTYTNTDPPPVAGDMTAWVTGGSFNVNLSQAYSQSVASLAPSQTQTITTQFKFGPGTATGTYNIPITWTIESN